MFAVFRGLKLNPRKDLTPILILAAVYVIAAKLGLTFASVNPSATAIWPPTGIAIAALIIFGYRLWPGVFIGAFAANLLTAGTILTSTGIATGNTIEAILAAYLAIKVKIGENFFDYTKCVSRFFLFAGILSTAGGATIGVTTLFLGGLTTISSYPATWLTWWLGDTVSALIIAPFLIVWFREKDMISRKTEPIKSLVIFTALIAVSFILFGGYFDPIIKHSPLEYLVIPFITWLAVKFEQEEATLGVLVLAIIANVGTVKGFGPFAGKSQNESLLLLQMFLGVVSFANLSLSAIVRERNRTEVELRSRNDEIQRKFIQDETLLNSMGEGMIATDWNGAIISINPAALKTLDWQREKIVGEKLAEIIIAEDDEGKRVPVNERPVGMVLSGEAKIVARRDLYYVRRDGTHFPVSLIMSPLAERGEIYGAIQIFHDITAEKETEKAQNEFIAIASHQLRTPVANILWQTEMLLDKATGALNKKQNEYLGNIYRASERLNLLTNDLLNVSRIETKRIIIKHEDTDVVQIAETALKDIESTIYEKEISFTKKYDKDLGIIRTDPNTIRLTFQNLLSNAVKYTPVKGSVNLELKLAKDKLHIMVTDSGYGIPGKEQPKVFAKFFRGSNIRDENPDGTGLGLYIIKSLIDKIGGQISFESIENKGAAFHVILPI